MLLLQNKKVKSMNLIEKTTEKILKDRKRFDFDTYLRHFEEYVSTFGNSYITTRYVSPDNYTLGNRTKYIRMGVTVLTQEEKEILNRMGFCWENPKDKFDFERFYQEYVNYQRKHNSNSISTHTVVDGYPLGSYISAIRKGTKKLTDEQIKMLDEIGFVWNAKHNFDFEKYVYYYKMFNTSNIPFKTVVDGYRIGNKTLLIKQGQIKLSDEQRDILISLGFDFKLNDWRLDFDRFVKEYKKFIKSSGQTSVKQGYRTKSGYNLGDIYHRIRLNFIKLDEKQKNVLISLGFEFVEGTKQERREKKVVRFIEELKIFKSKFGHCKVKYDYVSESGYNLGKAVSYARGEIDRFSEKEKEELDSLGFIWRVQRKQTKQNIDNELTQG